MNTHGRAPWDLPQWSRRAVGDPSMPLAAEAIYAACRIIGDGLSGKRVVIGTGFLMTVKSEGVADRRHGYLITAAHLLRDHPGPFTVQLPDMVSGELSEPIPVTDWRHPVAKLDLVLAPFAAQPPARWAALRLEQAIPAGREEPIMPRPGTPVYYVGILTPLDRTMVRSGTLGAIDQDGVKHDGGWRYPCHLVDCRSYGGFSGSPCFFEFEVPGLQPQPLPVSMEVGLARSLPFGRMAYYFPFAGMFTQHLNDQPSQGVVTSRYGVGVMLRAEEIREVLMSADLAQERARLDAQTVPQSGPTLQSVGTAPGAEPSEFTAFRDLASKLARVSKEELDEERKADKEIPEVW